MNLKRVDEIAYASMAARKTTRARERGYIFYHGRRTARIALKLASRMGGKVDRKVLYMGALFHDVAKGRRLHNQVGARMARRLLGEVCRPEELDHVCAIILHHNMHKHSDQYSRETRIMQDADALDHVGPSAVWLALHWSAEYEETVDDALDYLHSKEHRRHIARLRDVLNFPVSVRMFDRRIAFQDKVFAEFERVQREGL